MNKLNSALYKKLQEIGRRMDSLPDQTFLMEMQRVREAYTDELNKIMEEHETESNGNWWTVSSSSLCAFHYDFIRAFYFFRPGRSLRPKLRLLSKM